jgi:hypothetical protein
MSPAKGLSVSGTWALYAEVVHDDEDAGVTFTGQDAGLISCPHLIRPVGGPALVALDKGPT